MASVRWAVVAKTEFDKIKKSRFDFTGHSTTVPNLEANMLKVERTLSRSPYGKTEQPWPKHQFYQMSVTGSKDLSIAYSLNPANQPVGDSQDSPGTVVTIEHVFCPSTNWSP